jgi:hypothetical protein
LPGCPSRYAASRHTPIPRVARDLLFAVGLEVAPGSATGIFRFSENHAFADDNKRIAFLATILFLLRKKGYRLTSETLDEINILMSLAAGDLSEAEFQTWLRARTGPYALIGLLLLISP